MPIGHTVSAAYSLIQLKNSPEFPCVLQHETDGVMPYGCEFVPRQILWGMYDDKTYLISLSYYVNVGCSNEWADESSFAGVWCTLFLFHLHLNIHVYIDTLSNGMKFGRVTKDIPYCHNARHTKDLSHRYIYNGAGGRARSAGAHRMFPHE